MNAWALGAAARVLDTTVHVQAASLSAPAHSAADVEAGLRLYRQDCQICHGGAAAKASSIARGLYQLPPQFGDGSMADDPENETYWKIAHGIRFTGMPAFAEQFVNARNLASGCISARD